MQEKSKSLSERSTNRGEYMKQRNIIMSTVIAGLILVCASAVSAVSTAPIWGTAVSQVDQSSSRTSEEAGGVSAAGDFVYGDFEFSWVIEKDQNKNWTYTYTITSAKMISNFILDAADDFDFTIIKATSTVEGTFNTWDTSAEISLTEMFGIKFDLHYVPSVTFTLVTERSPVWGVLFAASEKEGNYAWSTALSDQDYKANTSVVNFIARPGGEITIAAQSTPPESPTMLLVGACLVGLAGLGRNNIFKRHKK
jgi:hypothetical protein